MGITTEKKKHGFFFIDAENFFVLYINIFFIKSANTSKKCEDVRAGQRRVLFFAWLFLVFELDLRSGGRGETVLLWLQVCGRTVYRTGLH